MSNMSFKEDAAFNQLCATIKAKFEEDGILREVRCLLQSKIIAMMTDKNDLQISRSSCPGDKRMKLLHQLVMEYLHWHGFYFTAEIFSVESSCENAPPVLHSLEEMSQNSFKKDLPILLQLLAAALEKQNRIFS